MLKAPQKSAPKQMSLIKTKSVSILPYTCTMKAFISNKNEQISNKGKKRNEKHPLLCMHIPRCPHRHPTLKVQKTDIYS